jgi:hypothetical protein
MVNFNGMGYQQQKQAVDHSNRLPTKLAILNAILFHECVGIAENITCNLEPDPMLSSVRPRFGIVPLEPHHAMPPL